MHGGHGGGYDPPDPGSGVEFSWAVPNGTFFLPQSITFVLDTSGSGGSRLVGIQFMNGSNRFFIAYADASISSSEIYTYCFSNNPHYFEHTIPDMISVPIGSMILNDEFTIESFTPNLAGGDEFTDIKILGQTWLDPQ